MVFLKSKFLWNDTKVTCPGGKITSTFYDNKRAKCYVYQFKGSDCRVRPLKSRCTTGLHRTIATNYYQSLFDEAAEFNKTAAYKEYMKKRAHIEPKCSEMSYLSQMGNTRIHSINNLKKRKIRGEEGGARKSAHSHLQDGCRIQESTLKMRGFSTASNQLQKEVMYLSDLVSYQSIIS